ncbi:uncharacterized protein MYCFIDRAFT_173069 [Pseudocercospora fijiensis CIRAD86]|uniref:Uncharacterized protein n=1 Tax=Pseudocercospora fijiensis (strain CIRAD86) TaxID=383855 RepID=M3AHE7_PSEFD|nr:uncharacterized protein MYCFIDRAFT_173069 [Pseudocercospora fijiensis CIRAD86]EME84006.1 hypothetical protein MYCFIDRAFT_173069 [Pseudocercospora fijiensis CIRAD86]
MRQHTPTAQPAGLERCVCLNYHSKVASDGLLDGTLENGALTRDHAIPHPTDSEHTRPTINMNSMTINPPRASRSSQVSNNISHFLRRPHPRLSSRILFNHPPQIPRHLHHTIRIPPTRRHNIHPAAKVLVKCSKAAFEVLSRTSPPPIRGPLPPTTRAAVEEILEMLPPFAITGKMDCVKRSHESLSANDEKSNSDCSSTNLTRPRQPTRRPTPRRRPETLGQSVLSSRPPE